MYYKTQDKWELGRPVIVSGVSRLLNGSIWHPDSFRKEFGTIVTDFIDCLSGNVLQNYVMGPFWQGFNNESARLINPQTKNPYLLKLKV